MRYGSWGLALAMAALACQRPNTAFQPWDAGDTTVEVQPDLTMRPDLAAGPDVASSPDLAIVADVAIEPDVLAAPPALVVNGMNLQDRHGAASGGTVFTDVCPGNQVLIGFRGVERPDPQNTIAMQRLALVCGTMKAVTGSNRYPVEVSPAGTLPERGLGTGTSFEMVCPDDEVVVRISGNSGGGLDRLQAHCGRLEVDADRRTVLVGSGATLTAHGEASGAPYDDPCPAGEVARGGATRGGQWIDAFTMICGQPVGVP